MQLTLYLVLCSHCLYSFLHQLKEHYRSCKKQNCEDHRFTSNLHGLMMMIRKHLLKYFYLKCHIWWEILRLEFIAQWAFYLSLFASNLCKMCNRFFTIFLWPSWLIALKLLQVCQFMYVVDYIKFYPTSNCFAWWASGKTPARLMVSNPTCVIFFSKNSEKYWVYSS